LTVFYRLFTASIRVLDRFRELLFHIVRKFSAFLGWWQGVILSKT
jgi:hypothetical protein